MFTRASRFAPVLALAGSAAVLVAASPEPIDHAINARIRAEARDRSQIMQTLHVLTDVYGPRLTGSPNHKAAAEWAVTEMKKWGFDNGSLEEWDFGHPGWLNERLSAHVVSPVKDALVGEALAWTNGTDGPVRAAATQLILPERPTADELKTYLDGKAAAVAGKVVLVGAGKPVPVNFSKAPLRRDYDDLTAMLDPVNPRAPQFGPGGPAGRQAPVVEPGRLTPRQINEQVDAFLVANKVRVRINDGGRDHGQIRAFNNPSFDGATAPPTMILRNEDFGRIARLLADGRPVELDVDIVNRWYPEGRTSYNAVAEIAGSDKASEVIMLGGHLDSWHAATGATDNAIGVAVMMEAARIVKTLGLKPRRTIRVALWGGEEQGLLGSKAYVAKHFGTAEAPTAEFATFGGYLNVDSGTGRIRGASVFGPPEAGRILREIFAPFEDLGIVGATVTKSRSTGGTDSTSFNAAGLPGIGLMQDPIEYQSYTWHTNLDTYERIVEDDVKKSAAMIASALYHLAMRDDLLPRFTGTEMPAPAPAARPSTPTPTAPAPTAPAATPTRQ
ncbi:Leupeptin-inactivating enzyme 1 precursor [Luteitalea pratensis]|uniref:Carboxypeptidase Q n=1 Tax=Luteitalea pratensis TaxID=1855912 RepID=A0A143PF17_LUTPR|nr:M20/M25/M40 family metallo-hydrolase [Luteitalea pratensis]AMY07036.1 Leupeptin-inactivating enzyme 1 precursor [Luteitalea pratensis]